MRRQLLQAVVVCLGSAWAMGAAHAQSGEPVKPYILFIADVSGSMADPTGFGNPSCALGDTRLNHLKCALGNIAAGYGDMIMGLGRFRQTTGDNNCLNGCGTQGINCSDCSSNNNCTPLQGSGDRFELLVPVLAGNQGDLIEWVDFTCGTCYNDQANNPELDDGGYTPIAGSLRGAKRYFQGLDTPGIDPSVGMVPYWTGPGDDPIRDDPLGNIFIGGEQCRPYIVIMLTDGEETCVENFSETVIATADLLNTDVDGMNYRIETKPIGFGQSPGTYQIEAMAHAGGESNQPDEYEGFYAQNEDELSLAISQIISDAIKFETCNELDDDCDFLIDEDYPAKGNSCVDGNQGICQGTGTLQCSGDGSGVTCVIDTPGQPPSMEVCNDLDDDCDSFIDEGSVCVGCQPNEACNNNDDDCDGIIDEGLTRPCGTDVGECMSGTETCVAGSWENCDAVGGSAEVCDGLDNDCNGSIDGFSMTCVTLPGNDPGVGICQAGTQVCPSDGSGMPGPCLGEVGPDTEACDNQDDDCDGTIDEDTGGDPCNATCGAGTTVCVNGGIQCESDNMSEPEVCDGLDNDCDGPIDEGVPNNGPCDPDGTFCEPGLEICIGGEYVCTGGVEQAPEACDCLDNDCDGSFDEDPDSLCPDGESCVACQCANPCADGEFPCADGEKCEDGFCVVDPCWGVDCPPDDGHSTVCVDDPDSPDGYQCVRACDLVPTCPDGFRCHPTGGVCVPDDCTSFPDYCDEGDFCVDGECVDDPCSTVMCPDEQYCYDGNCVASCADVECPSDQACELGQCVDSPCDQPCPESQVCDEDTGECAPDPCVGQQCPTGEACNPQNGECELDPCLGVTCPGADQVCRGGSCYGPDPGDGPDIDYVTAAGGGCEAQGGGVSLLGMALLLAALALGLRRRRAGFLTMSRAGFLAPAIHADSGGHPGGDDRAGAPGREGADA